MNVSLPTNEQWKNVVTAAVFSFMAGFLATLTAQGGFQVGLGWEGTLSLIGGAMVSGINATMYALYITFFKKAE